MSGAVPVVRRVYMTVSDAGDGKVELGFSLMAPSTITDTMAVLVLRGTLPAGFPQDIPLVSDPSEDPDLRGLPGQNATDAQVATAVAAYLTAHPPTNGRDGTSPTIKIGTVTTLAAGQPATVTNSGTSSAMVLDIGIPQGAAGSNAAATPLASAAPAALATTAAVGGSAKAAREDHAHPLPAGLASSIGTITVGQNALVAISAGVRTIPVSLVGVVKDGNYLVFPAVTTAYPNGLPAGYQLQPVAVASADGVLQVTLTAPILAIGASYSISARVLRIG